MTNTRGKKKEKILLLLCDVDGCIYWTSPNDKDPENPAPEIVKPWLINNNQSFLNNQRKKIKEEQVSKVILAHGTARQTRNLDKTNKRSNNLPSMAPMLPIFQDYLNETNDGCEIVIDPFLMADLYGRDKTAGEHYKKILDEEHNHNKIDDHGFTMYERDKLSLIYTYIHRTALLHPQAEIVIDFYDDRKDILNSIYNFYTEHTQLLPHTTSLRLNQYAGGELCKKKPREIKGTGDIDATYEWSVRYVAARHYFFRGYENAPKVKSWKELKDYHEKQEYPPSQEMCIGDWEDKQNLFYNFQNHPDLPKQPSLQQGNYTNAYQLYQQDLIPKTYLSDFTLNTGKKEGANQNDLFLVTDDQSPSDELMPKKPLLKKASPYLLEGATLSYKDKPLVSLAKIAAVVFTIGLIPIFGQIVLGILAYDAYKKYHKHKSKAKLGEAESTLFGNSKQNNVVPFTKENDDKKKLTQ